MILTGKKITQYADIFIVAGQSNAGGFPQYGNPPVSGLLELPIEYQGFQPKFYIADYSNLNVAHQRIVLDEYRWGIEQELGHRFIKYKNRPFYCLKNWRGGIYSINWNPTVTPRDYLMWEELSDLINNAIAYCAAHNLVPRFRGIDWVQGENEAIAWVNYGTTADTRTYYAGEVGGLIDRVRSTWSELADTPWILHKVSAASLFYYTPSPAFPYNYNAKDTVNPAMDDIAGGRDNVLVLDPDTIGTPNPALVYNQTDGHPGTSIHMGADFQHYNQLDLLGIGGASFDLYQSNGYLDN